MTIQAQSLLNNLDDRSSLQRSNVDGCCLTWRAWGSQNIDRRPLVLYIWVPGGHWLLFELRGLLCLALSSSILFFSSLSLSISGLKFFDSGLLSHAARFFQQAFCFSPEYFVLQDWMSRSLFLTHSSLFFYWVPSWEACSFEKRAPQESIEPKMLRTAHLPHRRGST